MVALAPGRPRPRPGTDGTGANATQPSRPSSTSGQTVASDPVTPSARRAASMAPGVKPTASRLGSPTLRAISAKAVANCSAVPDRVEAKADRRAQLDPGVAARSSTEAALARPGPARPPPPAGRGARGRRSPGPPGPGGRPGNTPAPAVSAATDAPLPMPAASSAASGRLRQPAADREGTGRWPAGSHQVRGRRVEIQVGRRHRRRHPGGRNPRCRSGPGCAPRRGPPDRAVRADTPDGRVSTLAGSWWPGVAAPARPVIERRG